MNNTRDKLLTAALAALTPTARKRLLVPFTADREGMARTSTTGHAMWYPIHLSAEREAAALLGLPAPLSNPTRRRRIEVNTTPYVAAHGKAPRGRGGWAFGPNGDDSEAAIIWSNGLYSEAVREAKRRAPEGTTMLAVLS